MTRGPLVLDILIAIVIVVAVLLLASGLAIVALLALAALLVLGISALVSAIRGRRREADGEASRPSSPRHLR